MRAGIHCLERTQKRVLLQERQGCQWLDGQDDVHVLCWLDKRTAIAHCDSVTSPPSAGSIPLVCWHSRRLWCPADCLFSNAHKCQCHVFWVGFGNYSDHAIFSLVFAVIKHIRLSPSRIFHSLRPLSFQYYVSQVFLFSGVCRLCKQLFKEDTIVFNFNFFRSSWYIVH